MIRAIVFDLGGVLFSEGKSVALEKLAAAHGYERRLVGAILSSPESIQLRKGLIPDEDFWQWAQQRLPSGYDSRLIQQEWYNGYVLDKDIYELIASLQKKYSMIAFSGNIKSRVAFLEEKYHFRHLFDIEVYSFDFHMTKPEPEFVRVMIERSGARPEEIVYIEDNESYAKPARDLGVNVVIYQRGEIERLRQELRRQGVVC
ncbi:MAG: HAD-IA family hydrolase [Deltaproteobacteria bacterium]|nr:HAD-IA family hydrolase [Deltaproteobacteria bacterium]MBI2181426.1 HAD-IA family hydrolase [Deltaproteobacteria bacterium]MBI2229611.1 HAD-IA family hydrolase [Deltaproteobacteria bacterium]MBI2368447.1 HAD-IA family hydrolase [Deltaproteobacteria bacterium]